MKKLNPLELKKHVDETNAQRAILKDIVFVENGVEVVGQIYVKKVSYKDLREIEKSFNWLPDEEDPGMLTLQDIDELRLRSAQILATVCVDEKGTPFFKDIDEVLHSYMNMCKAMWSVSNEVNLFVGKLTTKNSTKTKSSRNSRSKASAGTALNPSETTSLNGNSPTGENTGDDAEA